MITTPEVAEEVLVTCVYDVRDFVDRSTKVAVSYDELIDTIVSCVATDTWAENGGGEAQIRPLQPGLIVISQTRAVHNEVRALLTTVREMRERTPRNAKAAQNAAVVPNAERVVTRAYLLEMGQAANPEAVRGEIRDLITSSLPDERWHGQLDDGQAVLLTILPDRIVLRHKPSVQNDVEKLLSDSGLASPIAKIGGEMAGRSGYGGYGRGYGGGYGGYGTSIGGEYGGSGGRGYGGRGGYGAEAFGGSDEAGHGEAEGPQPEPAESD
jgi:hypothetical protein